MENRAPSYCSSPLFSSEVPIILLTRRRAKLGALLALKPARTHSMRARARAQAQAQAQTRAQVRARALARVRVQAQAQAQARAQERARERARARALLCG